MKVMNYSLDRQRASNSRVALTMMRARLRNQADQLYRVGRLHEAAEVLLALAKITSEPQPLLPQRPFGFQRARQFRWRNRGILLRFAGALIIVLHTK